MIAFVRGQVAAVTPDQRRAGGRRRRPRADVHARHPRHAAHRPRGHAADQHGGARGLADPLRLRSTRTRSRSSSSCRPPPASGPKLAQAMLAVLAPDDLRRAIAADDVKTLTRVPGIGQKGAQRIILELKDRIGAPTARRRRGAGRGRRAVARPGAAGPGRARLVGQGRREGGRGRRRPGDGRRRPDVGRAAARRPAHPEQGLSRDARPTSDELDGAPRRPHLALADRRRGRGRRAGRRGGAAPAHASTRSSARPGCATSSAWCSRRPAARPGPRPRAAVRPARASARPRWR